MNSDPSDLDQGIQKSNVQSCVDEYERLTGGDYDDSPWTQEELQALVWERGEYEDCDKYADMP